MRYQVMAVVVSVCALASPAAAQRQASSAPGPSPSAPPSCESRQPTLKCERNACELLLPVIGVPGCTLRIDDAWLRQVRQGRITEATSLRVRVVGVNFLRYGLKFETREKVVDSYVALEKLWQQAFSLLPGDRSVRAAAPSEFVERVKAWRLAMEAADVGLSDFLAPITGVTLTTDQPRAIEQMSLAVDRTVSRLEQHRQDAAKSIGVGEDFGLYDATLALHEAVVTRLRTFQGRAKLVAGGLVRRITFGEAGRIVTVTITLADLVTASDPGLTETVEFFVHSTMPVTFHAGYAYSALDAFEFEPVASAASGDLFSQINEAKNTSDFTAFLSYRLGSAEKAALGSQYFVTIGTDFAEPGKRLYFGGSFRVKKVLVSAGVATGTVKEGEGGVPDAVAGAGALLGTRELFSSLATSRQWRPFAAISFAPF